MSLDRGSLRPAPRVRSSGALRPWRDGPRRPRPGPPRGRSREPARGSKGFRARAAASSWAGASAPCVRYDSSWARSSPASARARGPGREPAPRTASAWAPSASPAWKRARAASSSRCARELGSGVICAARDQKGGRGGPPATRLRARGRTLECVGHRRIRAVERLSKVPDLAVRGLVALERLRERAVSCAALGLRGPRVDRRPHEWMPETHRRRERDQPRDRFVARRREPPTRWPGPRVAAAQRCPSGRRPPAAAPAACRGPARERLRRSSRGGARAAAHAGRR